MEQENEAKKQETKNKENRKCTIFGFNIWRILAYFILYSFIGYLIETVYGMVTKGVWESRQSFLYGPFCGIYGLGAVVMIIFLQYFNQNNNRLFIGGFIIGSIVEYIVSWYGEIVLHVKWWDYSNMPLNINGRICVFFSLFWGLLAIYLMSYVNPRMDKLIDFMKAKISQKGLKILTTLVTLFLFLDCLITGYAIEMFLVRKVHEYNLPVAQKEEIEKRYEEVYQDKELAQLIHHFFGDEKMIKTFPNLKTQDVEGNMIYFDSYVGDIKPYYYKFESNWRGDLVKVLKHEDREGE